MRGQRGLCVLPRSLAVLGALVAFQALAAASAGAASVVYGQIGSFGGKQVNAGDPGLFSASPMPQRLAVDPSTGDIFVADTGNNRIEVFQPTATSASFLLQFGSSTTTNHPVGVAVDPATGDVYVSCAGTTNAIVKFDPDSQANPTVYTQDLSFTSPAHGTGTGQIGSFGSGSATSPNAGGIAVDPATGDILVADPGNDLIQRFTSTGTFISSFDGSSSGSAFTKPFDLAVNGAGDVIVADVVSSSSARVLRFTADGSQLLRTLGPVPNAFPSSSGVVLGADRLAGEAFVSSKSPALTSPGLIFRFGAGDQQIQQFGVSDGSLTGLMFGMAASSTDPGRLYVLGTNSFLGGTPRVQVFAALTAPDVAIAPPTGVTATQATLHGTVNPQGSEVTDCHFEYVPQSDANGFTDAQQQPCDANPGGGTSSVAVQATASGLAPNTTYRVRLVALNNGGATSATSSETTFTAQTAPPAVTSGRVYSLSDTGATVSATVNPENSQVTDCHFDYGTTTSYGQTAACSPAPGAGGASVAVTADLQGLTSDTTYHFRIVADNGTGGPQSGDDRTFATLTAAAVALPARGDELVSAADTNGIDPFPQFDSADGDHYAYSTFIPAPGSASGHLNTYFVSSRQADGSWTQRPVGAPAPPAGTNVSLSSFFLFSGDFSAAAFQTAGPIDPDDQNGAGDIYRMEVGLGTFGWVSRDPAIAQGTPQTDPANAGPLVYVSPDGQRVLFRSVRHLLGADASGGSASEASLYEWDDGELSLVGIPPGQTTGFPSGSALGSSNAIASAQTVRNAVSRDGSRIVFQSPDGSGNQQLYVRVDGQRTVQASASAPGVSPPVTSPLQVNFEGADVTDNDVFFTSSSALTGDSSALGSAADLYRYAVPADGDPADGRLTDLTPFTGGAGVTYVLDVSDDGQRVYFLARSALTPDATTASQCSLSVGGDPGRCNLYVADLSGSQVKLTFIATVGLTLSGLGGGGNLPNPAWREISATDDGSLIAFRSADPLVPGRRTGGLPQIYAYDASRDTLSCASCPPDGSNPTAGADMTPSLDTDGNPVGNGSQNPLGPHVRAVTTDGSVFFQTASSLLPADTNGKIDVYEWRGGALGLISGGTSSLDAMFAGASADGQTVFFRSADSLVPGAQEGIQHIYAARVGGGGFHPPTPPPPCTGDDCRGAPSGAPALPTAASVGFTAAGNPSPPAAPAKAKLLTRTVRGASFLVKVKVPAGGRVTITGAGIKTVRRSVSKAGMYRLRVALTAEDRRALARKRKLKLKLRVAYRPASGRASAATVSLTIKPALRDRADGGRAGRARRAGHKQGGAR